MRRPERGATFLLAHVTDPHFRGWFAGPGPADFIGKRAVGALNLAVNRGRKHKMQLLEALRLDLRAQAPDHLALTGDLSNMSLPASGGPRWRGSTAAASPPASDQRDPREPRRVRRGGGRRRARSSGCSPPT